MGCYLVANILSGVVAATSSAESGSEPMWVIALSALALWVPFLAMLVVFSQRVGTKNFVRDYFFRFRWVDLLGIPLGVASQLVLVN